MMQFVSKQEQDLVQNPFQQFVKKAESTQNDLRTTLENFQALWCLRICPLLPITSSKSIASTYDTTPESLAALSGICLEIDSSSTSSTITVSASPPEALHGFNHQRMFSY